MIVFLALYEQPQEFDCFNLRRRGTVQRSQPKKSIKSKHSMSLDAPHLIAA
jgi:hypothetical protein